MVGLAELEDKDFADERDNWDEDDEKYGNYQDVTERHQGCECVEHSFGEIRDKFECDEEGEPRDDPGVCLVLLKPVFYGDSEETEKKILLWCRKAAEGD